MALLYIALYGHSQRVPTETPQTGARAGSHHATEGTARRLGHAWGIITRQPGNQLCHRWSAQPSMGDRKGKSKPKPTIFIYQHNICKM